MEASEAVETTPSNGAQPEHSPAEARHAGELFRYSEWVHVGPGAEECEEGEDGKCRNPMHFHAWLRLPNQFQHESIQEKAAAAKARRIRVLRDPKSDAATVLDGTLEETERMLGEEGSRQEWIEELVKKDFARDYFAVQEELRHEEPDEDEEVARFATIDDDRERLAHLESLPHEDRPEEEFAELRNQLQAYREEIERRIEERQRPVREGLQGRDTAELRRMVREERIQHEGTAAFLKVYAQWEQYIGTLKPRDPERGAPNERVFADIEQFKAAAPEVISALEQAFMRLDSEFSRRQAVSGKG